MTLKNEITNRLIGRAKKLGYTILAIEVEDDLGIGIMIRPEARYTPELHRDWKTGEWMIQTTAYGSLNVDETEEVAEGYGRAAAMVTALHHLTADDLTNYSAKLA